MFRLIAALLLCLTMIVPAHAVAGGARGLCCAPVDACCQLHCSIPGPGSAVVALTPTLARVENPRQIIWPALATLTLGVNPAPELPPPRG